MSVHSCVMVIERRAEVVVLSSMVSCFVGEAVDAGAGGAVLTDCRDCLCVEWVVFLKLWSLEAIVQVAELVCFAA